MNEITREMTGLDFDWLALDRNGRIALLTTAGGTWISAAVDPDRHASAIERIRSLPELGPPVECPELPNGERNLWREVALRGLYAYDGSYFGDPYRRIAVPARPLHITELPDDIASLLRADASLASVSFAEMSSLATPTD